jgi:adenosylhomocysteinase
VARAQSARAGEERIAWAGAQMEVLGLLASRLAQTRALAGVRIGACLHLTAETANLARALAGGGAQVALCAANPLSTQDDVVLALNAGDGVQASGRRGESARARAGAIARVLASDPHVILDDGAELIAGAARAAKRTRALLVAAEETSAGLIRARALHSEGHLPCPVYAVNESRAERTFNDRYGTGQSTLDGILRATNLLIAGRTVVVIGYGPTGRGVALRARGAGAVVIVCEVDPLRALEARMDGYEVLPALSAAERGDLFITVTGSRDVLRGEHFARMHDGALLANAGHFDVEIALADLHASARSRQSVRPLVERFTMADGRRLNLLAQGRVVNLAAGEGHPAAVMDISFALQALCVERAASAAEALAVGVHPVPAEIDRAVAAYKLAALGVRIDEESAEQQRYRTLWER